MNYIFQCKKSRYEIIDHFQQLSLPWINELNVDAPHIRIGNFIYYRQVLLEEIHLILKIVKTEWYHIQSVILGESVLPFCEIQYARDVIHSAFYNILDSFHSCSCPEQKERNKACVLKELENFSHSVIPIPKLKDEVLIKMSTSATNDIQCPIYQYLHSFLDIQYYLLMLFYICEETVQNLEIRIISTMKDLIMITKKKYKRRNMQHKEALCDCIEKFWLILQLFTEKIDKSNKSWFWQMFNKILEDEDPIFTLWLLKDITQLQSLAFDDGVRSIQIRPNYTLLENKLKDVLSNSGSETYLKCFKIITPLLSNFWLKEAKIEIFQIIWDHYTKRLNISMKEPPKKAIEFNDLLDTILSAPLSCNEDFEVFVGMLIGHLKKNPSHWGKMKGRIFSKLGPNKIKELNEIGITHVLILFLSLANFNLDELSKKIISFLENLPTERRNTLHVWNIYTVFIIRSLRELKDIEEIAPLMLKMLQEAVNDHKLFHFVKEFMENFEHIINYSLNYQLHQWLLINTWLQKYLTTCYYGDLKNALNVLLSVLNKVSNADDWPFWETAYKDFVYPSLKQISNTPAVPDQLGRIGGRLCLLTPSLASDSFSYFNSDTIPPRVSCQFLIEVLSDFPHSFILSPSQELTVLQSWMKVCLTTTDSYKELTINVSKLDCLPSQLKMKINSEDPIQEFIEYLGSHMNEHIHSNDIIKLCDTCFGQIDKWLVLYLAQPEDEAITLRIYTCISLAFLNCGPLLYDRNKSTSPLTKLVQVLLLPTDFLMGKKILHPFVLSAIKKTWHVFFEAIVKLNSDVDTFLERTLRDMLLKYMQFFSTTDLPVVQCLMNSSTAPVILDKISSFYLKHPVKESNANTLKVLKILNDFVLSTTSLPLMRLIINKCLYGLFEIVIFHSHKLIALGVIKAVTCSPLYPQVSEDFRNTVVAVTEKHLAFNTINYFQLMSKLAKFATADIKASLENIKQHIRSVERMRGIGFDKNLRTHYEKLEKLIETPL